MQLNLILEQLIQLSHEVARDDRDLAMLGEGNTSADCGDGTFWVKASGAEMATIDASGFSRVSLDAIRTLMAHDQLTDQEVQKACFPPWSTLLTASLRWKHFCTASAFQKRAQNGFAIPTPFRC
jgi:hypothetical protein